MLQLAFKTCFQTAILTEDSLLEVPVIINKQKGQIGKEPDYYLPHPPPSFQQINEIKSHYNKIM